MLIHAFPRSLLAPSRHLTTGDTSPTGSASTTRAATGSRGPEDLAQERAGASPCPQVAEGHQIPPKRQISPKRRGRAAAVPATAGPDALSPGPDLPLQLCNPVLRPPHAQRLAEAGRPRSRVAVRPQRSKRSGRTRPNPRSTGPFTADPR